MDVAEQLIRRAFSRQPVPLSSNDGSFGPGYNGEFDFTILFENIFFSIVPSAIGILFCIASLVNDRGSQAVAKRGALLWGKLVSDNIQCSS